MKTRTDAYGRFGALACVLAVMTVVAISVVAPRVSAGDEPAAADAKAVAIFAAGCFWCTEADFDKLDGVVDTTSGFIGGTVENPTYKMVTSSETGHLEAVRITYDPAKVTYDALLAHYWKNVDPFDDGGQFCDRGTSYKPAIFAQSPEQQAKARESKRAVETKLGKTVVVPVRTETNFTAAENYHQDYHQKNPWRYWYYRTGCGRDARLAEVWGKQPKS